jgi:hypothetical protein
MPILVPRCVRVMCSSNCISFFVTTFREPIGLGPRTVSARSNTAIVGSNPT